MKIIFCLDRDIMFQSDNNEIPQINSAVKINGMKYKVGNIMYDYDNNEVVIQSTTYMNYIQDIKNKKAMKLTS